MAIAPHMAHRLNVYTFPNPLVNVAWGGSRQAQFEIEPDNTHHLGPCISPTPYPLGNLEMSSVNWRRVISKLIKSRDVFICPSNSYAFRSISPNEPPGDESNRYYPPREYLPISYSYNTTFFHEAVPSCWYGEPVERPRFASEISENARLIMLVESRLQHPGLGTWSIPWVMPGTGDSVFQSHNRGFNFLFADLHVKRLKLSSTCSGKMWTDRFPDLSNGCISPVSY